MAANVGKNTTISKRRGERGLHWRCGMKDFETDDESSVWPWVTGIVMLAMVIWVAAELSSEDASRVEPGTDMVITAQAQPRPGPAAAIDSIITPAALSAWVSDSAAAPEWTGDDASVRAGLARLAAALDDLARRTDGPKLQQRAAALQQSLAGQVWQVAAVDSARAAMLEASAIAGVLHEQLGTVDGESDSLAGALEAAQELDPAQPLQQQRLIVHRYFTVMAQALLAITPAT